MKTIIGICLVGLVGCGGNGFTSSEKEVPPSLDGTALPTPMESDAGGMAMGTGGVANLPSNNGGKANVTSETGGMPSAPMTTGNGGSPALGTGGAMVNGTGGMVPMGTGGMVAETGGVPSNNGGSPSEVGTGGTVSTGPHCPVETDPDLHCVAGTYMVDCVGSLATFRVDRLWAAYIDQITSDAPNGFNLTSTDAVTGFHFTAFCQGPVTFTLPIGETVPS